MGAKVLFLLSAAALCGVVLSKKRAPPLPWRARREVTTTQGVVRGYLGSRHFAYLGIPYASRPTKSDRFKAPEPPPRWDGVFEATYRVKCPQPSTKGDENCLVVNVFTAQNPAKESSVMVLFHDGGFHNGWGELEPPIRFIDEFIIVTVNYRLGALGFLCLGIPEAPGNAGLKDQIAALYWVQQNIASFGGNPGDVTVYGMGAGAISVQLLLLSGLATGLMNKAILDSGSILSPLSMSYNPFSTAFNIAMILGYEDTDNTDDLFEFYRKLTVHDLVNISTNFLPCVENSHLYAHSMIDQDPMEILVRGDFTKIPLMIVFTKSQETVLIDQNYDKFLMIPELFEDLLPSNLQFDTEINKFKIAELVKDFYFDEHGVLEKEKVIKSYKEYINDIFMEYPMYKFSLLYAAKTTVPVYVMKFAPDEGFGDKSGGSYGEVMRYISAKDLVDDQVTVANRLVSLFINFMKIGDPTPLTTELVPVIWEQMNPHGLEEVPIDQPCLLFRHTLTMGVPPTSQQINFWDYIYARYRKKLFFDGE
ncbi:hypothetical protein O0L34_g13075 [Tuta absoluta]|nr:hypothetical protein O0L34_g13075 [Tuta absoluta]